ncbi:MAG: O-antigen ligase family protein [Candidatus Omnitrophica bacterium]|nr:O-antigen ligase family protein [Candidatus Omnitrophota bacterium]
MSMLLSPELVVGQVPGRDIVVRLEDFIIILLMVAWFATKALRKDESFVVKTPLNFNILLYALVFVLLTGRGMIAAGVDPLKGFFYVLKYLEYFMIYFLTATFIRRKSQVKLHVILLLATFAIVNIYAISRIGHDARLSAPFEGNAQPNTLGGYQVLLMALALGLFLHIRSGLARIILAGLVLLTIPPFLFTLSRSGYSAVFPMYLTFFIFVPSKRVLLLIVGIITLIAGLLFMPEEVGSRLKYTFETTQTQEVKPVKVGDIRLDSSASARIRSWQEVLKAWRMQPFFGYGVTGKGFLDGQYMTTLVDLGAIGFLAFIFLLGSISRQTINVYRAVKEPLLKGITIGFFAGHVGIMAHAITANTFIIIRIMEPYWFLAALVMVLPQIEVRDQKKEPALERPAGHKAESLPELVSLGERM